MKILKILLILVTSLIAAIVVGGLLVGAEWRSEAKQTVPNTRAAIIAAKAFDLKTWPQWTAWNEQKYPHMKRTFSPVSTGKGAFMTWDDGAMVGKVTITDVKTKTNRMDYMVNMDQKTDGDWKYEMACYFDANDSNSGAELTWGCWGNAGNNPVTRLMMQAYVPMMRKDFAEGLANLKAEFSR